MEDMVEYVVRYFRFEIADVQFKEGCCVRDAVRLVCRRRGFGVADVQIEQITERLGGVAA